MFLCTLLGRHTYSSPCARKDKVQMTLMSFKPRNSESTSAPLPHYECYLGGGDEDATITAVRAYQTSNNNPHFGPTSVEPINGLPAHYVTLSTVNDGAFGVFNCTAVKAGRQDTTIMTIFLRSNSRMWPADGLFTQTVSTGDRGIIIEITPDVSSDAFWWRINGSSRIQDPSRMHGNYESQDYRRIPNPVSGADNGVYECHYSDYRGGRTAVHAMQRLIVRACSSGKWGPPGCSGICDYCYNGGVCDDETGRCICSPGFRGQNCLEACGANKFGYTCEFECVPGGPEDSCRERLFCLLDPFGCRCNTGFIGLNCNGNCLQGKFGSSCLQSCHCPGSGGCNSYTGVCESGICAVGWSGTNCQIPAVCPVGYYGSDCTKKCRCKDDSACDKTTGVCGNGCAPGSTQDNNGVCQECPDGYHGESCMEECHYEADACDKGTGDCAGCCIDPRWIECPDGYYGESCMEECHCEADACDNGTGECVGCCNDPRWIDFPPHRCFQGFFDSSYTKVNPGQLTTVTCTVDISFRPIILLSRTPELADQIHPADSGLSFVSSDRPELTRHSRRMTINSTRLTDEYYCLLLSSGTPRVLAWLRASFSTYVLPVLSTAPMLVSRNQTSITIGWRAWTNGTDVGDPPVERYILYREGIDDDGVLSSNVSSSDDLQYSYNNLKTDMTYSFSVAAVRKGSGGEGPRGPTLRVKTLCDASPPPFNVQSEVITDTQRLNISWEVPAGVICSTGISGYTIYYRKEGTADGDIQSINVADDTKTWAIVTIADPGTSYEFSVSLRTDIESDGSAFSAAVIIPTPLPIPTPTPVFPVGPLIGGLLVCVVAISAVVIICVLMRRRRKDTTRRDVTDATYINAAAKDEVDGYLDLNVKKVAGPLKDYQHINEDTKIAQSYEVPEQIGTTPSHMMPLEQGSRASTQRNSDEYEYVHDENRRGKNVLRQGNAAPSGNYANKIIDDLSKNPSDYINETVQPMKEKLPAPIKVSELQCFMSRDKGELIRDITEEFRMLPEGKLHSCSEAIHAEKIRGKRNQMLPYNHSRVKLAAEEDYGNISQYYNASVVKVPSRNVTFIAAQEPRGAASTTDFWRMVWHEDVSVIVMLPDIDHKGGQYWPARVNTSETFGNFTVLWHKIFHESAVTQRTMKLLSDDNDKYRSVIQLRFNGWPLDQEAPDGPTEILHLIRQAKLLMNQSDAKTARILVHCRNGSGATGTFISLYTLLDDLQENKTISVFNVVKDLRNERMEMVQTKMQYLFIYQALQEGQTVPKDSQTQLSIKELSKMTDDSISKRAKREYAILNEMKSLNKVTEPNQDGVSSNNLHKNRFEEYIPLDEFRPVLETKGLTFGSNDYINATIVQEDACGTVILTQTPLLSIFEDFWRLVFDYQCSRVIMMRDTGGTSQGSSKYWPDSGSFDFGNISVQCLSAETGLGYTRHQFMVAHRVSKTQVTVEQLAFDIPRDRKEKLDKMATFIKLTKDESPGALLVHCLNGVGLSAVFAVVRSQMVQLEKEGTCDVLQAVNRMRKRNPHVITSQDEYALCLQLLKYLSNDNSEYETVS